jgi:hypothetical protein
MECELAELHYQLAKRDTQDAFARAPYPSTMMHHCLLRSGRELPRKQSDDAVTLPSRLGHAAKFARILMAAP